jgi:phospholipase C
MSEISRRGFLGTAAAVTGAAAVGVAIPEAAVAAPGPSRTAKGSPMNNP